MPAFFTSMTHSPFAVGKGAVDFFLLNKLACQHILGGCQCLVNL